MFSYSLLVYRAAESSVIFISSFVLSPKDKYLILSKNKSCVVYTFNCRCSSSYIGQTSRHLETRKKRVPKSVREHNKNKPKALLNYYKEI